ncbi:sensor histidine kinase [Rugamonas rivuli]|uniref:Histidine kinase/HSP90-like ATPase domain-containing protein n=1 Tax=Rugamonas rivuli TaxID=2743358 RepID=A0A843SFT3_9BURK|nr:sensor histidine kinase [Rugamonas rivuli]MQA23149.1 hypothetical protein [Rugamonas rivuli]
MAFPIVRRLLLIGMLMVGLPAAAIPPDRTLSQLEHRSWTAKDGVPPSIITMDQTDDGYLWLGTGAGLFQFDGVRFQPFQPSTGKISTSAVYFIKAQPGGGLWIGWRQGGISFVKDGAVVNYGADEGLSLASWWAFAFDRQGQVFAAGLDGVMRFDGQRWHKLGPAQGFTADKASVMFVDKDGTLAVFTDHGLFRLPPGAATFKPPLGHLGSIEPPQFGPDGRIYFMEARGLRIIDSLETYDKADGPWLFKSTPESSHRMLVDRSGSLWVETATCGVCRFDPRRPDKIESFSVKNGLSSNLVATFFEDREGNVWVATAKGLERFRQVDVNLVTPALPGAEVSEGRLLPGPANAMMLTTVAQVGSWLEVTPDGEVHNSAWLKQHGIGRVQVIQRGRDQSLWLAERARLRRVTPDGAVHAIEYPEDMGPVHLVHALAHGEDDTLWMSVVNAGVHRLRGGRWDRETLLPGEGTRSAMSILADTSGRMWFGYSRNTVVMLDKGKAVTVPIEQDGQLKGTSVLYESLGQIWAGGEAGLARYHDGRFVKVSLALPNIRSISSILTDSSGNMWLNSSAGTVRLDGRSLADAIAHPEQPVQGRLFDATDGRLGITDLLGAQSLAQAGDGKIWLTTHDGVAWIDPLHLLKAPAPPPVVMQALSAQGQTYRRPAQLNLPAGAGNVQIDYSSALLGTPQRMRFKYLLEGYDQEWQDAGERRQAFYTGLPPGEYRFRAVAENGAGNWGQEGPGLRFSVAASFYQTWWFKCLLVLSGMALVWLLHRLRLKRMELRIKAQMEVRHAERERIARTLHDTILQSAQALILRFDRIKRALPAADPALCQIDAALDAAQEVVDEGRERVLELRRRDAHPGALGDYLYEFGQAMAQQHGICFSLSTQGEARELAAAVKTEVLAIGKEALFNAVRHSGSAEVKIELVYASAQFSMTVQDYGKGLDASVQSSGKRPGHWGLSGMSERAQQVGGQLVIDSRQDVGTTVVFSIIARLAFG